MYFNDYVIGDVIQDVTAMALPSSREPEFDITYEIIEDSSICQRDKLFRSDGFTYTIKTRARESDITRNDQSLHTYDRTYGNNEQFMSKKSFVLSHYDRHYSMTKHTQV